jgi:hypothetical protein
MLPESSPPERANTSFTACQALQLVKLCSWPSFTAGQALQLAQRYSFPSFTAGQALQLAISYGMS